MYPHATLYLTRPLDVDAARAVLRGVAEVVADGDRLAAVRGGGAEVRVSAMPAPEIGPHLEGLRGYVQARCAVMSPDFGQAVDESRQVLGLVIVPGFVHGDAVWRWLTALARAGAGMVFVGGAFLDDRGRPLAAPPGLELATVGAREARPRTPPSPTRVVLRMQALLAVADRGLVEAGVCEDAAGALRALHERVARSDLRAELEGEELALIETPLGALDRQQIADATWRLEGAAVLASVLGLATLPPHDEQVDSAALKAQLATADTAPVLCSADELTRTERRLLAIHWRLRQLVVAPGPVDFVKFSQEAWFGAFDLFGIPLIDRDLAVGGAAITRADRDLLRITASIAAERHQAIAWLSGDDPRYAAVDTST